MRVSFVVVPAILESLRLAAEILILDEQAVEELLDPAGCLAAVERALVAVARGEVHLPLRTMVRPPGDETLIGLMPAHRGGDARMYGLKTVVVVPDNPARGLDSHQGTVTLFDGETGQTIAVVNAYADHCHSNGCGERARDAGAGARGRSRAGPSWASGGRTRGALISGVRLPPSCRSTRCSMAAAEATSKRRCGGGRRRHGDELE